MHTPNKHTHSILGRRAVQYATGKAARKRGPEKGTRKREKGTDLFTTGKGDRFIYRKSGKGDIFIYGKNKSVPFYWSPFIRIVTLVVNHAERYYSA